MGRYYMFIIAEGDELDTFLYPRSAFSRSDLEKITQFLGPGKGDEICEDNIFVYDKDEADDEDVFIDKSKMIDVTPSTLKNREIDIGRVYNINTNLATEDS